MWCKLCIGSFVIVIGVIYRPPARNLNNAVDILDESLSYLATSYDNVMILGDLNVNFLEHKNRMSYCIESYNMKQLIEEPTRITDQTSSLLDPIFFSNQELNCGAGTINADHISDHRAVYCNIRVKYPKCPQKVVTFRDFSKFDKDAFNIDLFNVNWLDIVYINGIEEKITFLTEKITALFDYHAPHKTVRVTKPRAPWINSKVKKAFQKRDKALTKFKRSNTTENWNEYKVARNEALSLVRKEKSSYIQSLFERNNTSQFYKTLKSLKIQNSRATEVPQRLSDANAVNNYFASVYKQDDSCCAEKINFYKNNKFSSDISFNMKLVDIETIVQIVSAIKSNAKGVDDVSLQMVKLCLPAIAIYLLHIVNCCIEVGYFPQQWKVSQIRPAPKNNNPEEYRDLRPVTILPIFSKILEKVICKQIMEYVSANQILPESQSGFRKNHSTVSALANLSDEIISALDKSLSCILVSLDMSKAFDTISHDLLLAKCKYIGFDSLSIQFLDFYLKGRTQ
nr:unnamed protein product [Callosobruchus chinensis]